MLLAVTALALLAAALAPATGALLAAGAVVGVATVVPQLLLPMAAGLVSADRRGAVIGTLQGGLIGGILLARSFGGTLGDQLGWRAPYLVAAVLTVLLAIVLHAALPDAAPAVRDRYTALLAASVRMLRTERTCGAPRSSRPPSSVASVPPGPRWPCWSPVPATAWTRRWWACWR